jgi:hypothetical protein
VPHPFSVKVKTGSFDPASNSSCFYFSIATISSTATLQLKPLALILKQINNEPAPLIIRSDAKRLRGFVLEAKNIAAPGQSPDARYL